MEWSFNEKNEEGWWHFFLMLLISHSFHWFAKPRLQLFFELGLLSPNYNCTSVSGMLLTSSSEDSIQRWGLVASEVTRQQCSKQKSFRNKADGERKAVHGLKHGRAGHYFVRKESRQCGNQEISWILQTTGYEEMKEKMQG